MATITTDKDAKIVAKDVKPDYKRRVILPKSIVQEGIMYDIYLNHRGQIILDPRVTIPASEAWVFSNPDILVLVKRGLADAAEGRVSPINLDTL
jgi:hypothetical protein